MVFMAKKTIKIEGLGERTLALEPLYRVVDNGGRITVGKNLIGRPLLILALIPVEPADLVYSPKPKRQPSLIDPEVFMKSDIMDTLESYSEEQNEIEELKALFIEQGWEGPKVEDIDLMGPVIHNIMEDLWSMPLEEMDESYYEELKERLYEDLLEERTEQDVAIINMTIERAKGIIERATEEDPTEESR